MKLQSLNRVQLIGRVCEQPKRFEEVAVAFVRLLVEVDEYAPDGNFFSSYHVVVLQEKEMADEESVGVGDVVFVEGRLNPYVVHMEGKSDRTGFNIQGSNFFVMRRNQDRLREVVRGNSEAHDQPPDVVGGPEKVVALFGNTAVDKEPPL